MATMLEMVTEIMTGKGSRPFPAKFAGKCALSGTSFIAGTTIRMYSFGLLVEDVLRILPCTISEDMKVIEATAARIERFDADRFLARLNAGEFVSVYAGARRLGYYRKNPMGGYDRAGAANSCTEKQLVSRLRAATLMVAEYTTRW